jgi:hypothetical protein
MNRLLDAPGTSGSSVSDSNSRAEHDSSANPWNGVMSSLRFDPFAPDLDSLEDDCESSDGHGACPTFTPADVPFPMMRNAKRWMRSHPVASALTLLGVGVAAGVALYEMLQPRSETEERMQHILADLDEAIAVLREERANGSIMD